MTQTSEHPPSSRNPAHASGPPVIRVRHLSHRFGDFDVLRDVSFEVGTGEIFGFIGPNGAGKTTTIRILATLLEPTAGRIEVDGHDVTIDPEAVRRVLGYMPDHAGVYDRVTVREYLEFFGDAYRVSAAMVDSVMELTDLGKLQDKFVATMSKGMKQRLQLARTLLHDPKVLILDEPASDLDPRARIEMRDLLLELRRMGKTILLSSHILTELSDICTSVAILERGAVVVSGPINDIARRLEAYRAGLAHAPSYDRSGATGPTHAAVPEAVVHRAKLKVLAPREVVAAHLSTVPHVKNISRGPAGTILVAYTGGEQELAAIVRALVLAEVPVCGVEPERDELERIFLEVTKGDVQ